MVLRVTRVEKKTFDGTYEIYQSKNYDTTPNIRSCCVKRKNECLFSKRCYWVTVKREISSKDFVNPCPRHHRRGVYGCLTVSSSVYSTISVFLSSADVFYTTPVGSVRPCSSEGTSSLSIPCLYRIVLVSRWDSSLIVTLL